MNFNCNFVQNEHKVMYQRALQPYIMSVIAQFPVISITGPRQSGKTTLCKMLFPDYDYYNLETDQDIEVISQNIHDFLRQERKGLIIDEAHNLPNLFSEVQVAVDEDDSRRIVLSGSSNFLIMQSITQSLAGRAAIIRLLPLSLYELGEEAKTDTDTLIYKGFYPAIWGKGREVKEVYNTYFTTYIQRDVQQIVNVKDLRQFRRFVQLCATRVGQEFVASSIADELAISIHTVNSWLSVLEASYITFTLSPYFRNMGKRIVKTPKLYFYDTGLVCYLLGLKSPDDVRNSFMRGALFENLVVAEMMKNRYNAGMSNVDLYFYRDKSQKEVDVVEELAYPNMQIFEIKSATAIKPDFFRNMNYFRKIYGHAVVSSKLIYDGSHEMDIPDNGIVNFRHVN
ncbi:MAG: ATP-binding protein [Paludibacteraceae bacterium]|nr:ATP-binding protein [Paludibacteraceae bacterium]